MQAIILAGGFGTRLKHVIEDVPKPMAPINGVPFLEVLLNKLDLEGVTKIVIAVGYKKEVIINHFGHQFKNISILYSEENEPLGTGGAALKAMQCLDSEYVYLLNGDTIFDIDFNLMKTQDDLVMAIKFLDNTSRYGSVSIKNNYLEQFNEKQNNSVPGYINGGIYRINTKYFLSLGLPKVFSFEKNFLEVIYKQKPIRVVAFDSYFIDIGIPEDYFKFQKDNLHE